MKIAIAGCVHGELDKIYKTIEQTEARYPYRVDLLLVCGDFQALRNYADLEYMAVPEKYKAMGTFHKYYMEESKAPMLTIVIGGNHEASNYMWELYHGGWLAPNIYFLGHSGCVNVNGIRIAGSSGIWKSHDFTFGHFETLPYDKSTMRSIYHTRKYDVFKLSLLTSPTIFLSHDWPQGIEKCGDTERLLKNKPFFRSDVQSGQLGSPAMMELLKALRPAHWFSAHLHVKFSAVYDHHQPNGVRRVSGPKTQPHRSQNPDEITIDLDEEDSADVPQNNPDEIVINDEDDEVDVTETTTPVETKFLALDKVLGSRPFLDIMDITLDASFDGSPVKLFFDPEWLAITRAMHPYLSTQRHAISLPTFNSAKEMVNKELQWVKANILSNEQMEMEIEQVQQFTRTAPGPIGQTKSAQRNQRSACYTNPQTEALCGMLGISNKINPTPPGIGSTGNTASVAGVGPT